MADLSFIEKRKLEKLLRMESGYVLSFSDRTFRDFIVDSVDRDIDSSQYQDDDSNSKAKRLRRFWSSEPNYIVSKLIYDFIEMVKDEDPDKETLALVEECNQIAGRLSQTHLSHDLSETRELKLSRVLSATERLKLIQTLGALPGAQFEEMLFALNPPSGSIPGSFAPQGSRSKELLTWLEGPTGPGLLELEMVLKELLSPQSRHVEQTRSQNQSDSLLRELISELNRLRQLPRYDLRGAVFGGSFAETVHGDQKSDNSP